MNMINDGGPAFPVGEETTGFGMALRDYFAAKAMQGICADPEMPTVERTAELAYRVADAMLRARKEVDRE